MNRLLRTAAVATALGLVALTAGSGAAPAHAESRRGQLTYSCQTAGEGYEDDAVPYPFVVAFQVDVPEQVRPGEQLRLSGVFSVQFPEELRSLAEDYFTYAQAVSEVVTVPVTVNGRTTKLKASRFDSGKVSTKNQPLVLSSAISAAPFTVPAGASGNLTVELPANDTVTSNIDGSKVAFHAEALLTGGFVATFVPEYVYKAACTAPAGAKRTVATIPVVAPTKADPTDPSAPAATAPAGAPDTGGTPDPGAPTVGAPTSDAGTTPSATTAPTTPGATTTRGAVPVGTPRGATTTAAAVPVSATTDGTSAVLLGTAVLVVLAAFGLAGWSHHRVRLLRAELEG